VRALPAGLELGALFLAALDLGPMLGFKKKYFGQKNRRERNWRFRLETKLNYEKI
jgi:hypothetical protein